MSSSYFVTYGTDRLTFGGSGSVSWEYTALPPKILVEELYKNPTSGAVASIPLTKPLSAFDYVQIHAGWKNSGLSQQLFTVPPQSPVNIILPLVDGSFRFWCMANYTGNGTTLTRTYISNWQMYSRSLTTDANNNSLCIYGISGVKYV